VTTIVTTTSARYATLFADQGITGDYIHPDMGKIIQQGTWLIGVAGDSRVCDVLQYGVKYPKPPESLVKKPIEDWYGFIVTKVIPAIAKATSEQLPKNDGNTLGDSDLLLVTHGKAFFIGASLGLIKATPYWAIGSGEGLALGVLSTHGANADWDNAHKHFAMEAMAAAKKHDPYTRGAITGWISYPTGRVVKAH